jgi:energy-coupling factor transporter transmembrane protein EcfT
MDVKKFIDDVEITATNIKKEITNIPLGKLIIFLLVIGFGAFLYTAWFAQYLSSYGAILANVSLGLVIFWAIDKFALKDINTVEELKKGNVAYAIYFLSITLIILGSIIAS